MKNTNIKIWRFLYKFHRYIGLSSAIILLMLAITGIALNHTEELSLNTRMIQSGTILDWYGIKSPDNLNSFSTKNHWLTQSDQQIYLDHSPLSITENKLIGAIETNNFIAAAFRNSILLLSSEGETIERITIETLEEIGINSQLQVIIKSKQLIQYSNDDLISWHPYTKQDISWSTPSSLPTIITNKIKQTARSNILPLERVLLDLHSGRFFGTVGVVIIDLCGLLLIFLVLSGCAIWLKHKLRSYRNPSHRNRKHQ